MKAVVHQGIGDFSLDDEADSRIEALTDPSGRIFKTAICEAGLPSSICKTLGRRC